MKNLVSISLTALMVLTFTGCGGSGEQQNNGSAPEPIKSKPKLSLTAQQYSKKCRSRDEPLPGLTVLLHRDDGKIHSSYLTGPDGKLDVDWPADARHVTLVHKDSQGEYLLRSYTDRRSANLGTVRFASNSAALESRCDCKSIELDWRDLKFSMPEYGLTVHVPFITTYLGLQSNQTVSMCKNEHGKYEKLTAFLQASSSHNRTMSPAYMAEFDLNTLNSSSKLLIKMSDFKQNARLLPVSVSRGTGDISFSSEIVSDNNLILTGPYYSNVQNVQVFELPDSLSYVAAQRYINTQPYNFNYNSHDRTSVSTTTRDLSFELPDNSEKFVSKVKQLFQSAENPTSIPYDFSDLGRYQMFYMWVDSSTFTWRFEGPVKGRLLDLQLPDAIAQIYEQSEPNNIYLGVVGFKTATNYEEHLKMEEDLINNPSLVRSNKNYGEIIAESVFFFLDEVKL